MDSQPLQELEERANLLQRHIAEHGLPPGVELPAEDIPRLTEEEQRATIDACEALAAGDEDAGRRLNELWEEIWDRLDVLDAEEALAEEGEPIPLEDIKKKYGFDK
jgi:hypothetical protein